VKSIYKLPFFIWLASLVLMSQWVLPSLSRREFYPFFKWNFFVQYGRHNTFYVIKILSIDGEEKSECYLDSCVEFKVKTAHDVGAFEFAQDFGFLSEYKKDDPLLKKYQDHLNTVLLREQKNVKFQILKRQYDFQDSFLLKKYTETVIAENFR
jgi:hypothetical protein